MHHFLMQSIFHFVLIFHLTPNAARPAILVILGKLFLNLQKYSFQLNVHPEVPIFSKKFRTILHKL